MPTLTKHDDVQVLHLGQDENRLSPDCAADLVDDTTEQTDLLQRATTKVSHLAGRHDGTLDAIKTVMYGSAADLRNGAAK